MGKKTDEKKKEVRLVIETAFGGGSLALFEDEKELGFCESERERTKSEDLLSDISCLLEKNKIEKSQICEIVYSTEAGSQTGLRIGRATAEGLSAALDCKCYGVSVLQALTLKTSKTGLIQTATADAKSNFRRQIFERDDFGRFFIKNSPQVVPAETFFSELENFEETILLDSTERNETEKRRGLTILDNSENIARLIGLFKFKTNFQNG